jgi:hypothetical protein
MGCRSRTRKQQKKRILFLGTSEIELEVRREVWRVKVPMAPVAMPVVHPLLVGLVDPRTPSRPLYNDELKQALRNVTSVLPFEEVPDKWRFLLHSRHTLNHSGPLRLARFLWGNGIDPPTICLILQPLVKVQSQKDIEGILGSLAPGTYDTRWWYFPTPDAPVPRAPSTTSAGSDAAPPPYSSCVTPQPQPQPQPDSVPADPFKPRAAPSAPPPLGGEPSAPAPSYPLLSEPGGAGADPVTHYHT